MWGGNGWREDGSGRLRDARASALFGTKLRRRSAAASPSPALRVELHDAESESSRTSAQTSHVAWAVFERFLQSRRCKKNVCTPWSSTNSTNANSRRFEKDCTRATSTHATQGRSRASKPPLPPVTSCAAHHTWPQARGAPGGEQSCNTAPRCQRRCAARDIATKRSCPPLLHLPE